MTTNLKNLPKYSTKDELYNSITHLVGLLFSFAVLIFFIFKHVVNRISFLNMIPYYFYALSMMAVFLFSTLYHTSKANSKRRVILRIIDHSDIYLFVAGTYFPICMYGIENRPVATAILITEFALAITGVLINAIPNNSKLLKTIGYIIYILDGWLLIFFFPFGIGIDFKVFLFVLIGGIVYTVGAITYAIGKKHSYFHSIFHIFVVLAAITQFIGIYFLIP